MTFDYVVRPLDDKTWIGRTPKRATAFKATLTATLSLLDVEVGHLLARGAATPVVMVDVTESDLRVDGRLRAHARPASDAVALAFESRRGPLMFRCDRFTTSYFDQGPAWQHNLRAIALTLEALRAVDRYGATSSGEQYKGFRALPQAPHMDDATAVAIITSAAGVDPSAWTAETRSTLTARARRNAHPDRPGGSRARWDHVVAALAHLEE